jgi:hypothetical protein
MARPKLVPRNPADYDQDFHSWTADQAARLRASRPGGVDWENLAEEIESLGRSDRRKIASNLAAVLEHLIKWKYQPEKRKGGWRSSIREHRDRIERILADSRSLARLPEEVLAAEYERARRAALDDTGLAPSRIPVACLFTLAQVLDPAYLPD